MSSSIPDITLPPDLSAHAEGTGPRRSRVPVYTNLMPPCNHRCPAGENVQSWLSLAQAGSYKDAWAAIMADNPFPAVSGRVCYHACENACNRGFTDSAVSIHAVERFLGDLGLERRWEIAAGKDTGRKVLVIGAGPCGLSAAYHLRRSGHEVTILEAGPVAGGMMHFGIPAYRLPRDILAKEAGRIAHMGVRMLLDHQVTDLAREQRDGAFDAVFIAIGAQLSRKVDIPAREAGKLLDALSFLRDVDAGQAPKLGRRVAIYGGGNTAMDAARVVQRLAGHEAMIIYRRDRAHMGAHEFEAAEALEEGVTFNWLRSIKGMDGNNITVEVMRLEDGRPVPTGQFETLEADTVILALGQDTDTGFLRNLKGLEFATDGALMVGRDMMTGAPGIFAGGDTVPGERTVAVAIGHGKRAARHIDAWLKGATYVKPPAPPEAGYQDMHLWYRTQAPQRTQVELPAGVRVKDFSEVVGGLTEAEAVFESQRCLSCGNCIECDGCFGACPEDAIIRLGRGKGYEVDLGRCTGCGVCVEQCPCDAIHLLTDSAHPSPAITKA
jgi:NADPH-dependent glutamate synthase beta subunit-like oxidoreductase